jgi:hypothetical protein
MLLWNRHNQSPQAFVPFLLSEGTLRQTPYPLEGDGLAVGVSSARRLASQFKV